MVETSPRADWALILGASSGFGAASARALALGGHHIAGVHFDLRATRERAERLQDELQAQGRRTLFFNKNAADEQARAEMLDALASEPRHVVSASACSCTAWPSAACGPTSRALTGPRTR